MSLSRSSASSDALPSLAPSASSGGLAAMAASASSGNLMLRGSAAPVLQKQQSVLHTRGAPKVAVESLPEDEQRVSEQQTAAESGADSALTVGR